MLEILFSSRVRAKILTAFFMSPGMGYNAWKLAQNLGESYSAVWKELARLEEIGLLTSQPQGNSKVYQVNPTCPFAPELRSLILKTEGIGDTLRAYFSKLKGIQSVFIYGSYASGEADAKSDLDLMVIGKVELPQFAPFIARLENELNRPINYAIFTREEWDNRLGNQDAYALNVLNSPKIMLIGEMDAL
jgi:predicted nucleotidyltransferase